MSAELATRLHKIGAIDFILCFAPSVEVASGIAVTFQKMLGSRFDGQLGALGGAYTYQGMPDLADEFWQIFDHYRVLVVFDEIHHCAGSDLYSSNVWGEKILLNIQNRATYTLALTGTPWRSDSRPIVLSRYGGDESQGIQCDYTYGLCEAVRDGVCRKPNIVLIDNDKLAVEESGERQEFDGIAALVKDSTMSYRSVLHNASALHHSLKLGCQKLDELRAKNPQAGGLIVATSVSHARLILQTLQQRFGQTAELVTYKDRNAQQTITSFRHGNQQWIVSVGMISEGTDIPRIQVCCHLSTITTELHFRQVLGRSIRITQDCDGDAWLYTFAEPRMVEYANRIAEDLPEHEVVFRGEANNLVLGGPHNTDTSKQIASSLSGPKDTLGLAEEGWALQEEVCIAFDAPASMEFLGEFQQHLCQLVLPS